MLSLPFPLSLEKEKHLKSVTLFSSLPHCVGEPGASQGWKLVIVQEYRDKCEWGSIVQEYRPIGTCPQSWRLPRCWELAGVFCASLLWFAVMSSLCDSSCYNHSNQYQHQPYCHNYNSIKNILLTNINTIQIIGTKLVTNRARASRAYHTGAGVWGHNPAVGGNAAEEVGPSSPFCHF